MEKKGRLTAGSPLELRFESGVGCNPAMLGSDELMSKRGKSTAAF